MIQFALAAMLQASVVSAPPLSYEQALAENQKTGKPLVVLVGAEWCAACRVMKNSTLPGISQDGAFQEVAFTVVDSDKQGEIARQMTQGGSIPQLILFHQTAEGWRHEKLVGAQNPGAILQFLRRGIKAAAGRIAPGRVAQTTN